MRRKEKTLNMKMKNIFLTLFALLISVSAYAEGVIEPRAIQLSDEFTRKVFSERAIRDGYRIEFTANRMQYASLTTKTKLIHEIAQFGMITTDEAREIIDLPPLRRRRRRKDITKLELY